MTWGCRPWLAGLRADCCHGIDLEPARSCVCLRCVRGPRLRPRIRPCARGSWWGIIRTYRRRWLIGDVDGSLRWDGGGFGITKSMVKTMVARGNPEDDGHAWGNTFGRCGVGMRSDAKIRRWVRQGVTGSSVLAGHHRRSLRETRGFVRFCSATLTGWPHALNFDHTLLAVQHR